MIDFVLMVALALVFGIYVSVHYFAVAAAGIVVGFFFGGFTFFLKILPVAFITFVVPLVYGFAAQKSFSILTLLIVAVALTVGYSAGAFLSVVFFPVKIAAKTVGFFFKLIRR
ncbi:MAG: hypothetical protein GOV01_01395 [Candidatus Altiarchaeota archaeon]|nr:hypothetical protein [Candidatus Altiarchaeota archaeon]